MNNDVVDFAHIRSRSFPLSAYLDNGQETVTVSYNAAA
jgi:hypothetical protein